MVLTYFALATPSSDATAVTFRVAAALAQAMLIQTLARLPSPLTLIPPLPYPAVLHAMPGMRNSYPYHAPLTIEAVRQAAAARSQSVMGPLRQMSRLALSGEISSGSNANLTHALNIASSGTRNTYDASNMKLMQCAGWSQETPPRMTAADALQFLLLCHVQCAQTVIEMVTGQQSTSSSQPAAAAVSPRGVDGAVATSSSPPASSSSSAAGGAVSPLPRGSAMLSSAPGVGIKAASGPLYVPPPLLDLTVQDEVCVCVGDFCTCGRSRESHMSGTDNFFYSRAIVDVVGWLQRAASRNSVGGVAGQSSTRIDHSWRFRCLVPLTSLGAGARIAPVTAARP